MSRGWALADGIPFLPPRGWELHPSLRAFHVARLVQDAMEHYRIIEPLVPPAWRARIREAFVALLEMLGLVYAIMRLEPNNWPNNYWPADDAV